MIGNMKPLTEKELAERYGENREAFKKAIKAKMLSNLSLAMLAISAWTAESHRIHIHKIWSLLGNKHRDAWEDYGDELVDEMLTGKDDFTHCLYFVDKELYTLAREIPDTYVSVDARDIAYEILGK